LYFQPLQGREQVVAALPAAAGDAEKAVWCFGLRRYTAMAFDIRHVGIVHAAARRTPIVDWRG
jgi:hypothetical protein